MKYGEELRFLGGLYDAVRGTYNTADSLIQFENKIDVAVEKDILSETTAYGIKKILPQNQNNIKWLLKIYIIIFKIITIFHLLFNSPIFFFAYSVLALFTKSFLFP